jgi:hypothetical protein
LDYLGSTCPKLLLEPSRTNLLLYSEQFDNAYWTSENTTITANQATAPDGTLSADLFSETTASSYHTIYSSAFNTAAVVHSGSIFLKKGTGATAPDYVNVYLTTGGGGFGTNRASVNVSNGTIGQQEGCSVTSQSYGNGWFRFTITPTSAALGAAARIFVAFNNNNPTPSANLPSYVGATTSNVFIWGAQAEAGAYATSYIPTTSAAVTRLADAASKTGITSLIGQTEGTLFVDFVYKPILASGQDTYRVSLSDGTYTNRCSLIVDAATIGFTNTMYITCGSVSTNTFPVVDGERYVLAFAYKNNNFAFYVNGVQVQIISSGTVQLL